ncbi:unnamed protein product [Vicia faba]|uniref:Uncharacterized protein n=1 Tax=Vicia faba TaxID=3906 RepID=A0AAV0ZVN5_VICFA|nr:unnamed protein product [Vicia faba]
MCMNQIIIYNIPLVVKFDLAVGGNLSNVPLKSRPMRNYHDILISSGEESREINLINTYCDKDIRDILSDIMTKPRVLKENDDHVHEDVEIDTTIVNYGVVTNHDQALE